MGKQRGSTEWSTRQILHVAAVVALFVMTFLLLPRPVGAQSGGPDVKCSPYSLANNMTECNGHGTCLRQVSQCLCDPGWIGFNCSIPEVPCSGEVWLPQPYGSFTDGYWGVQEDGTPNIYGSDLNCTWHITPDEKYQDLPFLLVFTEINLEEGYDWVFVYDGESVLDNQIWSGSADYGRLGFAEMPYIIHSKKNNPMTIQFVTDFGVARPGFKVFYGPLTASFLQFLEQLGVSQDRIFTDKGGQETVPYRYLYEESSRVVGGPAFTKEFPCPWVPDLGGRPDNIRQHVIFNVSLYYGMALHPVPAPQSQFFQADLTLKTQDVCQFTFVGKQVRTFYIHICYFDLEVTTCKTFDSAAIAEQDANLYLTWFPTDTSPLLSTKFGVGQEFLQNTRAGDHTTFTIQSRDEQNNKQLAGTDAWKVSLTSQAGNGVVWADIIDNGDGTYRVEYLLSQSGRHRLDFYLNNAPITGLPLHTTYIQSAFPDLPTIESFGPGLTSAVAGYGSFYIMRVRDRYNNLATGVDKFQLAAKIDVVQQPPRTGMPELGFDPIVTPPSLIGSVRFAGNETFAGDYINEWNPLLSGWYRISVTYNEMHVHGSPFSAFVNTGPSFGPKSAAIGNGVQDDVAGIPRSFIISDRDWVKNQRTAGGSLFEVHLTGLELGICPHVRHDLVYAIVCQCDDFYRQDVRECIKNKNENDTSTVLADQFTTFFETTSDGCTGLMTVAREAGLQLQLPADAFNLPQFNKTREEQEDFISKALGVFDNDDGSYSVSYEASMAGIYSLAVITDGLHIDGSPFSILLRPGPVHPPSVLILGRGVANITSGSTTSFSMLMRDKWTNYLWVGQQNVSITLGQGRFPCDCAPSAAVIPMLINTNFAEMNVDDHLDGTFDVNYQITSSGNFPMSITLDGVHLGNSPFGLRVWPGGADIPRSTTSGQGIIGCGAGLICSFSVQTRDPFGNERVLPEPTDVYTVVMAGPQVFTWNITLDRADDRYNSVYNITVSGPYDMSITHKNQHVSGSPFKVTVFGGLTTPASCLMEGSTLRYAVLGYPATFTVISRDRFLNRRTSGGENVQVFVHGQSPVKVKVQDKQDGSYFIEYEPDKPGLYHAAVSILGQDVPGSPIAVNVHYGFMFPHFNTTLGINFVGDGRFHEPGKALRITPAEKGKTGAIWFTAKQQVARGFETQFTFRISELSRHCKTQEVISDRCTARGGDGFAFVVQNWAADAIGGSGENLGYGGIPNSIALEFDSWYNAHLQDLYENHISIHTRGTEPNVPHSSFRLAGTARIPNLVDGFVHTVRVRYDTHFDTEVLEDDTFASTAYAISFLQGGGGVMTVWMDDLRRPVLIAPVNLNTTLHLPDGRAWIGFTSSTGNSNQNHDIKSWSLIDHTCPRDCSLRGQCVQGECHCDAGFSGAACGDTVSGPGSRTAPVVAAAHFSQASAGPTSIGEAAPHVD